MEKLEILIEMIAEYMDLPVINWFEMEDEQKIIFSQGFRVKIKSMYKQNPLE
jgi:hypothetical protein